MSKEKEGWIKKAEKLAKQGKKLEAISAYEKALTLDSVDARIMLKLAELCAETKDTKRAVQLYLAAAAHLKKNGFYSRATTAIRKILENLDVSCEEARAEFKDLWDKMGLNDCLSSENRSDKEIKCIEKMWADRAEQAKKLAEKPQRDREDANKVIEKNISEQQRGDKDAHEFLKQLHAKIGAVLKKRKPRK